MTLLSRDQILAVQDLKHEDVDVPEWGGSLIVRAPSGVGWAEYMAADSPEDAHLLIAHSIVEPELTPEQVKGLRESKGAAAFKRIETKILSLCGVGV